MTQNDHFRHILLIFDSFSISLKDHHASNCSIYVYDKLEQRLQSLFTSASGPSIDADQL